MKRGYRLEYSTFLSNGTELANKIWKPKNLPDGLIYIAHGMNESFEYYEEFANYAVINNKAVFMHEARGHGRTAGDPYSDTYFTSAGDAGERAIENYREDLYNGLIAAKKLYPGIPVTIVAHSLGTIVTLSLIENHKNIADNIVLIGMPAPKTNKEYDRLIDMAEQEIKEYGGKTASRLVYQEIFSKVNERFEEDNPLAFITRDTALNSEAMKYPFTKVIFNNFFFYNFLQTQKEVYQIRNIAKIDKELPILLLSGSDDYVTDYSFGTIEIGRRMKQTLYNIDIKIYPGARHSLLRETNRNEIMSYIIKWSWENKTDMERC